ncbi:hypothetical protein F4775DRAFT_512238 [Biscogniauxia sp. FL1348]|nr:hypothetical protein F4775DRAFT_512238 [Biscogniauxia sp. FL1348]
MVVRAFLLFLFCSFFLSFSSFFFFFLSTSHVTYPPPPQFMFPHVPHLPTYLLATTSCWPKLIFIPFLFILHSESLVIGHYYPVPGHPSIHSFIHVPST